MLASLLVPASSTVVPASTTITPPSLWSAPPQTPFDEPGAWTQGMPGQQSADVVHVSPTLPQEFAPPQMVLMQGVTQQSALVAQVSPCLGGVPPSVPVQSTGLMMQRGMPSESFARHRFRSPQEHSSCPSSW